MDYGYDTSKPEPTIEHIKQLDKQLPYPVTSCVHKINEMIKVINQLIPNKPRVYTEEEIKKMEAELK